MKFEETKYGNIANKSYQGNINMSIANLISLEGAPFIVIGNFDCSKNNLSSLEFAPKKIKGYFSCKGNKQLKNTKEQIIQYQIEANEYWTDEGYFSFEDIRNEFEKYAHLKSAVKSKGFKTLLGLDK